MIRYLALILLAMLCGGCPPTDTIRRTNHLQPGMTPEQVKEVMGEPIQTQFISERIVWKYSLHQSYRGHIPHYLVFEGTPSQLTSWFANQAEYERQQALWALRHPRPQRIDVNIR